MTSEYFEYAEAVDKSELEALSTGDIKRKDMYPLFERVYSRFNYVLHKLALTVGNPYSKTIDLVPDDFDLDLFEDFFPQGLYFDIRCDTPYHELPVSFLYSDFEDAMENRVSAYKKENELAKQRAATEKVRRLELCMSVYDKLTDAERSVVTFPQEFKKELDARKKQRKHEENMRMKELHSRKK